MRDMSDGEKAYTACFLDTDGTLTMRTRYKNNGRFWFEIRLIFFNCEGKEILEYLKAIIGKGCVTHACRYKTNKMEYKLVISKFDDVENLLIRVSPYMHLNRKQKIASILLEVCKIHKEVRNNQHPKFIKGERYQYPQRIFDIQKEVTELNMK